MNAAAAIDAPWSICAASTYNGPRDGLFNEVMSIIDGANIMPLTTKDVEARDHNKVLLDPQRT